MNMDYCKFENTLAALQQCDRGWNEVANTTEKEKKEKLIHLMIKILENEGYDVDC